MSVPAEPWVYLNSFYNNDRWGLSDLKLLRKAMVFGRLGAVGCIPFLSKARAFEIARRVLRVTGSRKKVKATFAMLIKGLEEGHLDRSIVYITTSIDEKLILQKKLNKEWGRMDEEQARQALEFMEWYTAEEEVCYV